MIDTYITGAKSLLKSHIELHERDLEKLIAAGEVEGATGAFSVKIPSAFDSPQDVMDLPVKVNGDRLIRLGDLADIRLTFEDADSTARYNGETTFALQVSKRKGFNVIDTAALVRKQVETSVAAWPQELQDAIEVSFRHDGTESNPYVFDADNAAPATWSVKIAPGQSREYEWTSTVYPSGGDPITTDWTPNKGSVLMLKSLNPK